MATLKRNHHYVPQFWQKLFASPSGRLYAREGATAKPTSPKRLMSADWIYTAFDQNWLASDAIEDSLSQAEAAASAACRSLIATTLVPSAPVQQALRHFIALQACRHPDVLGRGHRLAKDLGAILVMAHSLTESEFADALRPFGVGSNDAQAMLTELKTRAPKALELEFQELEQLPPHDPQLPHTEALKALSQIEGQLATMDLFVLDAAHPLEFVLGDTPVPQNDLWKGFVVPIARTVALSFQPTQCTVAPTCTRRAATQTDITASNQWQFQNAAKVTIGSDATLLNAL